jgi:hypothetical protein
MGTTVKGSCYEMVVLATDTGQTIAMLQYLRCVPKPHHLYSVPAHAVMHNLSKLLKCVTLKIHILRTI